MEWAAREALSWTDNILSGGYSLNTPYGYVPPQTVWFLRRFALKTGIDFTHFDLGSGMVFEQLRKCMKVFIVSIPNE